MRISYHLALCLTVLIGCQAVPHEGKREVDQAPLTSTGRRMVAYDSILVLVGTIDTLLRYGPPGYGERPSEDEKVIVPVLRLNEPITVVGDSASDVNRQTEDNVSHLQLVLFQPDTFNCINNLGNAAEVRGTLIHSHTGHHYTPVLLQVREIRVRSSASPSDRSDSASSP